jgi:hypothetical protein
VSGYVGLPYTKGSFTSKAAAESMVEPSKNQRQRVWEYIQALGSRGAICQEVELGLDICHQSCSTRMQELRQLGRLVRTGFTRKTSSRREADVHVVVYPDDWMDKRVGWPAPTKAQNMSEISKWKARALQARAAYQGAMKRVEELERKDDGCH